MNERKLFSSITVLLAMLSITCAHAINYRPNFAYKERDYEKDPIVICVDDNFWFPYTFTYKKKAVGLHTDISNEAMQRLKLKTKYFPKKWSQCLQEAQEGLVDALISVSYTKDRKSFINFPEDAARESVSKWRLTQVAYYIITSKHDSFGKKNNYEFTGRLQTLPKPIRIEEGYSIGNVFEDLKIEVQYGKSAISNYQDLVTTKLGSVITVHEIAQSLRKKEPYRGNMMIHKLPIRSKSYFMGFSKASSVSRKVQRAVWKQIKEIREDRALTAKWLKHYGFE